jgi:hypothetical protein
MFGSNVIPSNTTILALNLQRRSALIGGAVFTSRSSVTNRKSLALRGFFHWNRTEAKDAFSSPFTQLIDWLRQRLIANQARAKVGFYFCPII